MNKYLLLLLLSWLLPTLSYASAYRWTDDAGEVHYTQSAPKGRDYTYISGPPARSALERERGQKRLDNLTKDRAAEQALENLSAGEKEAHLVECTKVKKQLVLIKEKTEISVKSGDLKVPNRVLSDAERAAKIAEMQRWITTYCP